MGEIRVFSRTQRIIVDSPSSIRVVYAGPQGPPGTGSGGGGAGFVFEQTVPATSWTVPHNLGSFPPAVVVDDDDNVIIAPYRYVDENTIVVEFSQPTTGKVYL